MWVKASGKELSDSLSDNIFVPVNVNLGVNVAIFYFFVCMLINQFANCLSLGVAFLRAFNFFTLEHVTSPPYSLFIRAFNTPL